MDRLEQVRSIHGSIDPEPARWSEVTVPLTAMLPPPMLSSVTAAPGWGFPVVPLTTVPSTAAWSAQYQHQTEKHSCNEAPHDRQTPARATVPGRSPGFASYLEAHFAWILVARKTPSVPILPSANACALSRKVSGRGSVPM